LAGHVDQVHTTAGLGVLLSVMSFSTTALGKHSASGRPIWCSMRKILIYQLVKYCCT
jgi:hypothetical protein